jgi:hypothetical protein
MTRVKMAVGLFVVVVAFVSKAVAQDIFWGDSVIIGQGVARTFVEVDESSAPLAMGVVLTAGVLTGLPNSSQMHSLELPRVVSDSLFKHVLFDWNPHGHPPNVYSDPHFDFHFYTVTAVQRMEIVEGVDLTPVAPSFIPPNYVADGGSNPFAVGDMGVHYLDQLAPEFNGLGFSRTFIYGFYHGLMYFIEPMITREYLLSNPDSTFEIRQPEGYQEAGCYPTTYSIEYDDVLATYTVSIHDFVYQTSVSAKPEEQLPSPVEYALLDNYPNPFNPSTTIVFDVPRSGAISLRVFDLVGREVATLRDGFTQAGRHQINFDGRDLASGIYIVRLEAAGFQQTHKLVLIR